MTGRSTSDHFSQEGLPSQLQQAQFPATSAGVPSGSIPDGFQLGDVASDYITPNNRKGSHTKRPRKEKTLPAALIGTGVDSNEAYEEAINDPIQSIAPHTIGFMPSSYWLNTSISFGDLVNKFFHRKNNSSCRFTHKLFNALLLVENNPTMFGLVGVRWLTDTAFLVDKLVFGRLLGITSFDGGLFHRQGNFPSHGFAEVSIDRVAQIQSVGFDPTLVDHDRYRVLEHVSRQFTKSAGDEFFNSCKWTQL
jgi:hypothetical protein